MAKQNWFQKIVSKSAAFVTPHDEWQSPITFGAKGITATPEYGGEDPIAIHRPNAGKGIDPSRAMSAYNGWTYAAIKAIADEVAGMQFKVFEIGANNEHEELQDHDLLDLLDAPNETQTGPELKATIVTHLELTGNAYLLMLKDNGKPVSNETEAPKALYTLNPGCVKVKVNKATFPWMIVEYQMQIESKVYSYQPFQILHLKYPDPNDPNVGIGSVQCIASWIDLDNYATEFNRQWFIRGSKTGPVFESEAVDADAINRLRATYEATHQGVDNSHRPLILPKGFKVPKNPLGGDAKDMDFSNLMLNTRDKILAGLRTSKTILGTAESDTNRATAETADYVFSKRTIKPKMQIICSFLNEKLAPRFADNIYVGFLDTVPEDKNFRIQEMQAVMGNEPVLSLDETRERYMGIGPVKGGNMVRGHNNLMDIGEPKEQEHPTPGENQAAPTKTNQKTQRIPKTRFARNMAKRVALKTSFATAMKEALEKIKGKSFKDMTKEEYHVIWQKFAERVDKYEQELKDVILELNQKQEAEVLKNMETMFNKKALNPKVKFQISDIFNKDNWVKFLVDFSTPILTDLASTESVAAGLIFGKPGIDITTDPRAKAALDQAIQLMADGYNQTTLDALYEKIAEGLRQNSGYDNTAELVSQIYEYANLHRATTVARTETFRVANSSTKMAWKEIGVETIKWYTAEDGEVCPFCQTLDGTIIKTEDNFFNKGDTLTLENGKSMTFDYSDIGAPPLHPNCRCYQRPENVGSLE